MKKITKIVDSYERHRLASVILSILLVASVASVAFTQNASDNLWADAQAPPNVQGVPPTIKKFEVINVDATQMKQQAVQRKLISIPFEGKTYQLALEPNNLRAPDFKAILRTPAGEVEVPAAKDDTWKGTVIGTNHSIVRITIANTWISGYILIDEPDNWIWIFIEPLRHYNPNADDKTHFLYKTTDTDFIIDMSNDAVIPSEANLQNPLLNSILQGSSPVPIIEPNTHKYSPVKTARILLDGDAEFYNIDPGSWQTRQSAVINNVQGIYSDQMDITFSIVLQATFTSTTNQPYTSSDPLTLLGQFKTEWNGKTPTRHVAHLFTGKNLNGDILGMAHQTGLATTDHYSLTQHKSETLSTGVVYSASAYQKMIIAAHEIGHVFDGLHSHAVSFISCDATGCKTKYTIMWSTFKGDAMHNRFSHVDVNHDNEKRIRDLAVARL